MNSSNAWATYENILSYLRDRVCSIISDAGKFCLAHGLSQLKRDVNHDVRTLNFKSDVTFAPPRKTPNGIRESSFRDAKCQKMKEMTNNKYQCLMS